jgi:SpoVK/Ycf46/Vps4 family AAA+-type ATPase
MAKQISETIIDNGPGIKWEDICGLKDVKQALNEHIVLPQMRPELF